MRSLAQTLDYMEFARHKQSLYRVLTLDPLLLKLTEYKILRYISARMLVTPVYDVAQAI